jgi:succinate dehydrogenase / fumarate reductase cytochrome b subunit
MNGKCCQNFTSSIVKKQVMGITGFMLCGFLLTHMAGNTLMFISAKAFNIYAHALISNPFIYVAEAILGLIFLTHIGLAINLTIGNVMARPEGYYMKTKTGRGATFASSTMPYTGTLILIFLVIHLLNFKYGPVYYATYDGVEVRDLHRLMIEFFRSPLNIGFYIVAMGAVALHVSHGFWSAFQSMGWSHPKYDGKIKFLAKAYAAFVFVGYCTFPIWAYLQGVK